LLAVIVTYLYAIEFSAFAFGLGKVAIAIIVFSAFDRFVLTDIDTILEIKKGNIAYAIMLLAVAILIASAIINV
jgi:hypothetical protein